VDITPGRRLQRVNTERNAMKSQVLYQQQLRVRPLAMMLIAAIVLQHAATTNAQCSDSSFLKNPLGAAGDCVKDFTNSANDLVTNPVGTIKEGAENLERNIDEAAECVKNPGSCISEAAKDVYEAGRSALARGANALGEALGIEELETIGDCLETFGDQFCTTDEVRDEFSGNGWTAYYGKRLWDSQAAGTVLASIFPPTSAYGIEQLQKVLQGQADSLIDILETAADDIGSSADSLVKQIIETLLDGGDFDDFFGDVGIKAALLRVNCRNDWCVGAANGEGYYQIAFAWRLLA